MANDVTVNDAVDDVIDGLLMILLKLAGKRK